MTLRAALALAGGTALLAAAAAWALCHWQAQAQLAALREQHAQLQASAAQQLADDQAAAREVEAMRRKARERTVHALLDQAARDAADAAAAGGAVRSLRDDAAALAARACAPARGDAAAPAGAPASAPADLLADVLGRLAEAGAELAAEADRRGTAGSGCEREHGAVSGAAP